MFQYILKEMKVKPKEMLHIGPDVNPDYNVPMSQGIQAYLYKMHHKEEE